MRVAVQAMLLLTIAASISGAFGSREAVEHEGRVSIKGNDPHTFVALATDAEVFRLEGELAGELGDTYQNRIVRVVGYVERQPADAMHAVIHVESFAVVVD